MASLRRLTGSGTAILSVGLVGILGAYATIRYLKVHRFANTENYEIVFPKSIPGWKVMPKTPESLFIFRNTSNDFLMRGSASQVISDVNPTPDLNTNGIAQYYIDRTHENLKGWTAERSADIEGGNIDFSVIQRQQNKHTVITAFAVKGNTTLLVSISSQKSSPEIVDKEMSGLANCLKQINFKLTDMGGGQKAEQEYEGKGPD